MHYHPQIGGRPAAHLTPGGVVQDATEALNAAVSRFGLQRLIAAPGLGRNVLGDLLPHASLEVALLSAALEHGTVAALARLDGRSALLDAVPRTAATLAAARGLTPENAEWAVASWAGVLARAEDPTAHVDHGAQRTALRATSVEAAGTVESGAVDSGAVESGAVESGAVESGAVESGAVGLPGTVVRSAETPAGPNTVLRSAATPPGPASGSDRGTRGDARAGVGGPERAGAPRRRSRRGPIIAAAVVLLAAAAVGTTLAVTGSDSPSAQTQSVRALTGSAATVVRAHKTIPVVVGKDLTLRPGDALTASRGPVEVRSGAHAVLRLDTGARITVLGSAPSGASPSKSSAAAPSDGGARTPFELTAGRAYLSATQGTLGLRSPSASAVVTAARVVADCTGTKCTFQALQQPVTVYPQTGRSLRLTGLAAVTTDSTATGAVSYRPADLVRSDSWVAANLRLDKDANLHSPAIAGASVLGRWHLVLDGKYGLRINRALTIAKSCPAVGSCQLRAVQSPEETTCVDGHDCTLRAVVGGTADPDTVTLPFASVIDNCADRVEPSYGSLTVSDKLTFAGTATHTTSLAGTRIVRYTAKKGSACASSAYVGSHQVHVTGAPGGVPASVFPQPGDEERLLFHHTSQPGACRRESAKLPGFVVGLSCVFRASGNVQPPDAVEVYRLASTRQALAAYQQTVGSWQGVGQGACRSARPCNGVLPNGDRLAMASSGGATRLATVAAGSTVLVVAQGHGSLSTLYRWWQTKTDAFSGSGYAHVSYPA